MIDQSLDPRWPNLLVAARVWRSTLIPKTSTGTLNSVNLLIEAIEAFDEEEQ